MPFPQGGDFTRNVQSTFKVLNSDRRICAHDNGTNICDLGHKLKFPGTCLNQAVGTFNSTDPTFQPTFSICSEDYLSSGFSPGIIFSKAGPEGEGSVFIKSDGAQTELPLYGVLATVSRDYPLYSTLRVIESAFTVAKLNSTVEGSTIEQAVSNEKSSFFLMSQFSPGQLPHRPDTYSDLYVYDVYSDVAIYNRLVIRFLENLATFKQEGNPESFISLVDYLTTASGQTDICVGDNEPPSISYIQPTASGTVLRPINQNVEFRLSDEVGGVDLSSLKVVLNSTTTSGNVNLVLAGTDQTGGRVSITGDQNSYRVLYTPNFTWQYNDLVVITISGTDLPPELDGDPFFCGANQVNTFYGDIRFQVLNYGDFGASINVVGDTTPPNIISTTPVSGTLDNSVFTPVIIELSDDFTGVNISTIEVVVDGISIITNGLPVTEETVINGNPSLYTITYQPNTAFSYGSDVLVSVYAEDKATTPNILNTSYSFSCISAGTLHISNFLPAVGTRVNPWDVDIEVDITDDTYGIDESQSFLVINNTIVSGTTTPTASGIHLVYHPPNDFAFDRPIVVKVHGVNNNSAAPVVREDIYTLYYGYRILLHKGEYKYDEQVDVFVRARNKEQFHKDLSTGYFFSTYTQPKSDMGAFIQGITPWSDLNTSITGVGPEHRYGTTHTVVFYVEDYEGHKLGPYTFTYTIEDK